MNKYKYLLVSALLLLVSLYGYEYSIELGIRQLHFVRDNMGMTFEKIGNDDEAENQFRVALEIEPGWELVEKRLERLLERRAELQIEE